MRPSPGAPSAYDLNDESVMFPGSHAAIAKGPAWTGSRAYAASCGAVAPKRRCRGSTRGPSA